MIFVMIAILYCAITGGFVSFKDFLISLLVFPALLVLNRVVYNGQPIFDFRITKYNKETIRNTKPVLDLANEELVKEKIVDSLKNNELTVNIVDDKLVDLIYKASKDRYKNNPMMSDDMIDYTNFINYLKALYSDNNNNDSLIDSIIEIMLDIRMQGNSITDDTSISRFYYTPEGTNTQLTLSQKQMDYVLIRAKVFNK